MTIALIAHDADADASDQATTDGVDTTSADFLVAAISRFGGTVDAADSKSNTWTGRTQQDAGNPIIRLFDSIPTSVGASHTFSCPSSSGSFPSIAAAAFSGVKQTSYLDGQVGSQSGGASVATIQAGSITPSENGCLIITAVSFDTGGTLSINEGFTILDQVNFGSGVNLGVALAYKIQTTAAAVNPTWTHSGTSQMAAATCVYKSDVVDVTPPSLTSPTATVTGTTTATVGATTSEGNGTLYGVVTTSSTAPTKAQVKAGQDHTGASAVFADDQSVSGTGAKTFSATGLSENTGYYAHFMQEDAAANQSDVVSTALFTTRVLILVTDSDWFFSPYNWVKSGSTYAQSNNPGAYFKTNFSGTSVRLLVDVSPLSGAGVTAGNYPAIRYRIDGGAWSRTQLASGDTAIVLGTGLSDTTHSLEVVFVGVHWNSNDRWTTPVMVLRVTGLHLDGANDVSTPTIRSGRMLVYGDSHGEGWEVLAVGVSVANMDASQAYPYLLAQEFNCEVGAVCFAGQGYTAAVGTANVPDLEDAWDFYYSGQSRLSGGLLSPAPNWIFCAHGDNDSSGVQAAVESVLTQLRAAAPSAKIALMLPPNQDNSAAIIAGEAAAGDASSAVTDHGENLLQSPYVNGSHINIDGQLRYVELQEPLIRAEFPSSGIDHGARMRRLLRP